MKSLVTTLVLAAVMVAVALAVGPPGAAQEDAKSAPRTVGEAFVAAFDAGDADAFAACFAEDGEYVTRDGTVHKGRAAIRALAEEFFTGHPGAKVTARATELRPIGTTAAVGEGVATVTLASGRVWDHGRYTILYALEGGRWAIARFRGEVARADDLSPGSAWSPWPGSWAPGWTTPTRRASGPAATGARTDRSSCRSSPCATARAPSRGTRSGSAGTRSSERSGPGPGTRTAATAGRSGRRRRTAGC